MIERELKLLGVIFRNWVVLLGAGLLGALAGYYMSSQLTQVHEARAEIFVKFGNEYTVPSALSGSDRLLVDVDFRVALNGEIQIITSWTVISTALQEVPHPIFGTDPGAVSELVSAFNVENSPILVARVVDPDRIWSVAFLDELIKAYLERRTALFQRPEAEAFVSAREAELSDELITTRARIQYLSSAASLDTSSSSEDATGAVAGAQAVRTEIDLLQLRESVITELLKELQVQELKLDILTATAGQVELLSAPRISPERVGFSETELIVVMTLVFLLVVSAGVLLRETARA